MDSPSKPKLNASDRAYLAGVTVAAFCIAFYGAYSGMLFLMQFGILLGPIACIARWPRKF